MKKFLLTLILIIGFVLFCGLCIEYPETMRALIFPTRFCPVEEVDGAFLYKIESAQLIPVTTCAPGDSVLYAMNDYVVVIVIYDEMPTPEVETISQCPFPNPFNYNYNEDIASGRSLILRC